MALRLTSLKSRSAFPTADKQRDVFKRDGLKYCTILSMNALAIALHAIAATVWIGGMFFAYVVLRPTAATLEPPERLQLWAGAFKRFFPWVWMTIVILLVTGFYLVLAAFGGFGSVPGYVHTMLLMGLIMIGLFIYLYYVPYRAFKTAVAAADWPAGGVAMNRIRLLVLINLCIGLALTAIVTSGRYS